MITLKATNTFYHRYIRSTKKAKREFLDLIEDIIFNLWNESDTNISDKFYGHQFGYIYHNRKIIIEEIPDSDLESLSDKWMTIQFDKLPTKVQDLTNKITYQYL